MVAAQHGQSAAYDQLLKELDAWLRRYYARRLPPSAVEDAKQDALLAIHANRNTYSPLRPFEPWVAAIARYKWIDHLRDASRFAALTLHDEIATENREEPPIDAILLEDLLSQLKPAQACVIRLVKLEGVSIEHASGATGQSAALVKTNIHRGLKKLAELTARDAVTPARPTHSSMPRKVSSNENHLTSFEPLGSALLRRPDERTCDAPKTSRLTELASDRIAKSWRLDAHEIETFEKPINENCA
jgi:RNA polymerase sigma-70 factor (ECF subfamily)